MQNLNLIHTRESNPRYSMTGRNQNDYAILEETNKKRNKLVSCSSLVLTILFLY
jgi:hypothetical protein